MNKDEIDELLGRAPMSKYADYFRGVARPSIDIHLGVATDATDASSRFGGQALVPTDFVWPTHALPRAEYWFLGQINCSDLPEEPSNPMPSTGLLSFFYAIDDEYEVFWGDDGYVLAFYWPSVDGFVARRTSTQHEHCQALVEKSGVRISFSAGLDLPRHSELRGDFPTMDYDCSTALFEAGNDDYLFGYPSHHSLGYDPTPAGDWVSLLTVTSHDQLDWCWHDGDKLLVFIERARLARHDFSRLKSDAG